MLLQWLLLFLLFPLLLLTIISHFVRQANKSHAPATTTTQEQSIFMQTRTRTSNLDFPIGTRIWNWSSSNNSNTKNTNNNSNNAMQYRVQYKERNTTEREWERESDSLPAWQAQLISYCNCITTETRCYGKFPLVAVVVGAAAALLTVVLLVLFLLLCAYNSWSTARSHCSWLRCISIFIYQNIYLYNRFVSYDFSNRFAHLGEATLSACCLFGFVTISLRSQNRQRRQRRRSSARSTHTHTDTIHSDAHN